jgi:hypothetical protein
MKVINFNMLFLLRAFFSVNNKVKFLPNGHYIWPISHTIGPADRTTFRNFPRISELLSKCPRFSTIHSYAPNVAL